MIYFTADTHLNHYNIMRYCKRPFATTKEMDETIIANWNSVVGPNDTIYHLGDFAFCNSVEDVSKYLSRLHGRIHLILGNHDRRPTKKCPDFISIQRILEDSYKGQKLTLCHYAMRTWNCSHYGAWQLYGHSHGSLQDDPTKLSIDVGVDSWGFTPVSFEQVKNVMKTKVFEELQDE